MNSKRIIIIFVILSSITMQAQTVDSVAFRKAGVNYILQSIEMIKNKQCFRYNLEYADTNKIKLYIPWLKLRKPDQKEMNFQSLRQYIDERFDPYFQEVIIEKEEGIYVLSILKSIHKVTNGEVSKKKWKSGIDYNTPVISFFRKNIDDKPETLGYPYKLLLDYTSANSKKTVFCIFGLPEYWTFLNNKLIRLGMDGDTVVEEDGEEYYRNYLFPFSPKGIELILNGKYFLPVEPK